MSATWGDDPRAPSVARRRKVQLGPDRWVSPERLHALLRRLKRRIVVACVDLAIEAHLIPKAEPR